MGRTRGLSVALVATVLVGSFGGVIGLIVSRAPTSAAPLSSRALTALERKLAPAVLDVAATVLAGSSTTSQAGTAMVVARDGLALTNNHVLRDALAVVASLGGRHYQVEVLAADPSADLALIRLVGAKDLPTVRFSSDAPAIGERVVALGNALGLGRRPRLVSGEVIALNRTVAASDPSVAGDETLRGMTEADAGVVAGFSGGPLIDAHGAVIGVDTAAGDDGTSAAVFDFAIPSATATRFLRAARAGRLGEGIESGALAWLGILDTPVSKPKDARGVTIAGVVANGPAARVGIVAGDTISAFDGRPVSSLAVLEEAVARRAPGARCTVALASPKGADRVVVVRLGSIAP